MKRLLCYLMSIVFLAQLSTNILVYAQNDSDVRQHLVETSEDIAGQSMFAEFFQYDEYGRICGRTVVTEDGKKQYTYEYIDDTFIETVAEVEMENIQPLEAVLMSSSDPDSLINSPELIKRINSYKDVWNFANQSTDLSDSEKEAIKNEAHLQAQIARADYCVVNPTSKFAYSFLPDGRLETGTAFRRAITPDMENTFSLDVMALQRTLIIYGYLNEEDMSSSDYGYYNTQTQEAVKLYTDEKMSNPSSSITKGVIGKLFNISDEAQRLKRSLDNLSNIGRYRLQHDLVCLALAAQVQTSGTVYREGYLYEAGVNGNGGRFDVACDTGVVKYVWEVKPDTKYGYSNKSFRQLDSYINASKLEINKLTYPEYCPLVAGFDIQDRVLPWSSTYNIAYTSHPISGPQVQGMVFYRPLKKLKEVYQYEDEKEKVTVTEKSKEYVKVTAPEPIPLRNGLVASEVNLKSVLYVGGTLILIGIAIYTGQYWIAFA